MTPDYVYGIWFVPGDGMDFLATLKRPGGDGPWTLEYRFRYHASPDPFDQRDRKNWYTASMADGSDEALQKALHGTHKAIAAVEQQFGSPADFIRMECRTDEPKFFVELASRPWAHVKQMSEEEARKQGFAE